MAYSNTPRKETLRSIVDAIHVPFWLDDPSRPTPEPQLTKNGTTDLLVIGAGFTGLWTALLAKEETPSRDVLILEAGEVATGATGRNGGFMDASITHGFYNGLSRWPKEFRTLLALGIANLDEIESTIKRLGIECDYRRTGDIDMATEPYQVNEIKQ
jgi:glycine/D-amino acid oxidase-like deaminating enzyme